MMTPEQYNNMVTVRDMFGYFQQRNAEVFESKDKEAFNILDMNFALSRLKKCLAVESGLPLKATHSIVDGHKEQ